MLIAAGLNLNEYFKQRYTSIKYAIIKYTVIKYKIIKYAMIFLYNIIHRLYKNKLNKNLEYTSMQKKILSDNAKDAMFNIVVKIKDSHWSDLKLASHLSVHLYKL